MARQKATAKDREQRGAARRPVRWEVMVPLAGGSELRRVHTVNLSRGGLMFSLAAPATMPATATVILSLPDGRQVELETAVRHAARRTDTGFEVGVQFGALDQDQRRILDQALASAP